MKPSLHRINCLLNSRINKGQVIFHVSGKPSGFNITYKCSPAKTCQEANVPKRWTTSLKAGNGEYVFCSAQANKKNANVTVEIFYKGKLFRSLSGNGDYARATASGILA
jgi:hypothetical protein